MLYRVLKPLSSGEAFGDVINGDRFKPRVMQALLTANAICEINGPPLATLRGWTRRAELLAPLGIKFTTQFLDADDEAIAAAWGHKTTRAVTKAKKIVEEVLDARVTKKLSNKP